MNDPIAMQVLYNIDQFSKVKPSCRFREKLIFDNG